MHGISSFASVKPTPQSRASVLVVHGEFKKNKIIKLRNFTPLQVVHILTQGFPAT